MYSVSSRILNQPYGRTEEQKILRSTYQRVCENKRPELVVIEGAPGTGRTTLVHAVLKNNADGGAVFVTVKPTPHDQEDQLPYPVFSLAMSDFIETLLGKVGVSSKKEEILRVVRLSVERSPELISMVPALSSLLGTTPDKPRFCWGSDSLGRLRESVFRLVAALTEFAPLILFLDKPETVDTASNEMLRCLLINGVQEGCTMRFLMILNKANVEVESDPSAPRMQQQMEQSVQWALTEQRTELLQADRLQINVIKLSDLTERQVREMLNAMFRTAAATELAPTLFGLTSGNLLQIVLILRLLVDQKYIVQDLVQGWQWDLKSISEDFRTIEAVRDLIRRVIQRLPRLGQETLKVASIMGDEIDDSALDLCLQTSTGSSLECATSEGILVFNPEFGGYRFAHDWVRQVAFDLIPTDEQEEFHLRIGRKLWKSSSRDMVDKNIFVVVSLLNRGSSLVTDERERYRLADMNLRAGKKAIHLNSYPDATRFLRKGIQLLGPKRWQSHYDLSLALYTTAAEVEARNGTYERVVTCIDEVVKNSRSIEEKLRAYASLIRSIGDQDDLSKAAKAGVDILKQMGEPLPQPTKFAISKELVRVKVALKMKSNEEILSLPKILDPSKIALLDILNLIFVYAYQCRSHYATLVSIRSILMTLKYGLHEHSAVAFAMYGMTLVTIGFDVQAADRYGQLAISIAEKLEARDCTAFVHFVCCVGITHWSRSVKECIEQATFASRTAMELGDNETGIFSGNVRCIYLILTGSALLPLGQKVEYLVRLSRLFRKRAQEIGLLSHLQLVHCLTGQAPKPARLTGTVINFDELMEECIAANHKVWAGMLCLYGLLLAYLFGDIHYAAYLSKKLADVDDGSMRCGRFKVEREYYRSLVAIASIRQGVHERANRKLVQQSLKLLAVWSKSNPCAYKQKYLFLRAELISLNTRRSASAVLAVYDEALMIAKNEKYANEAALIQERAGDFLLSRSQTEAAHVRWKNASEWYLTWGATAKASHLCNKMGSRNIKQDFCKAEFDCKIDAQSEAASAGTDITQ